MALNFKNVCVSETQQTIWLNFEVFDVSNIFLLLYDRVILELRSCARGRQWCDIIHYY